jgi:hypothetical protein
MYFGQYHPLTCIAVARALARQVSSASQTPSLPVLGVHGATGARANS